MKIIHIESGLGNQMLAYAEYLAIKKMNPNEECYIETIIYEIPEASKVIAQWNGYELDRIFDIKVPNVKDLFTDKEWKLVIDDVKKSRFWENHWSYPDPISKALSARLNIEITNNCQSLDCVFSDNNMQKFKNILFSTTIGYKIRSFIKRKKERDYVNLYSHPEKLYFQDSRDMFCGFTLLFQYRENDIDLIDEQIRQSFIFPSISDNQDVELCRLINESESVAIHIRRGDRSSSTNKYYSGGYFKRAVKFIKEKVAEPVFFIFSDPDSCDWAKNNSSILGIEKDDKVHYVDWHKDQNSFRDMQLISYCKHAIITVSSFSWWGAYLICNKKKIVISPEIEINTNYHL